jgi:anti-anti-sigma factor
MPPPSFSTHVDDHEAVLVVAGDLDLASCDELQRHIRALVAAGGAGAIVVDLADVTFIDSSGLSVLVVEATAMSPRPLTLRRISRSVRRVLEVTATLDRFELE